MTLRGKLVHPCDQPTGTIAAMAQTRAACDVVRSRSPDSLGEIGDPGVAAAIWQRELAPALQLWIDHIDLDQLTGFRIDISVSDVRAQLPSALAAAGLERCAASQLLCSDITQLATIAGKVLDADWIVLRLDVSLQTLCPKFHQDNVRARLLCTYRGSGTEYVPKTAVDVPARYRRMATGAVGLFRGARWPGAEASGLLHRSPETDGADQGRIVLVIDPAD